MIRLLVVIGASLLSAVLGHFVTAPIVFSLFARVKKQPQAVDAIGGEQAFVQNQYFIRVLGGLERFIYTAGWLFGRPEIILGVLALKAAPQLKAWSETQTLGRTLFNIWLIGNLINVVIAVLVAEMAATVLARLHFSTPG